MIKTEKELLTELRNEIEKRRLSFVASSKYFLMVEKKAKQNTQEIVDARNKKAESEHKAKLDKDYVRIIDELLSNIK